MVEAAESSLSWERYVPSGEASLREDAPGYHHVGDTSSKETNREGLPGSAGSADDRGPTCWKCHGSGKRKLAMKRINADKKKTKDSLKSNEKSADPVNAKLLDLSLTTCPVCSGSGRLPAKRKRRHGGDRSNTLLGRITRGRKRDTTRLENESDDFCVPAAGLLPALKLLSTGSASQVQVVSNSPEELSSHLFWAQKVLKADTEYCDIEIHSSRPSDHDDVESRNPREELVVIATDDRSGSNILESSPLRLPPPSWVPAAGADEELCNLVGRYWRILQKGKGNHRYTTDDVMTAYVASMELPAIIAAHAKEGASNTRYLDLGTGNGSVLQMVTWSACRYHMNIKPGSARETNVSGDDVEFGSPSHTALAACARPASAFLAFRAVGMEARSEAVNLARRSLAFNVGENGLNIRSRPRQSGSVRGNTANCVENSSTTITAEILHGDFRDVVKQGTEHAGSYHLITGTPPYFRVDFCVATTKSEAENTLSTSTLSKDAAGEKTINDGDCAWQASAIDVISKTGAATADSPGTTIPLSPEFPAITLSHVVTRAVIRQGGMPTAEQSAPARCEFRGGIEAYLQAISLALHPSPLSRAVICINAANHERVIQAVKECRLQIVRVVHVHGKVGKSTLFNVYVLSLVFQRQKCGCSSLCDCVGGDFSSRDHVYVRDSVGGWTSQYVESVLKPMGIF
jgi:hypothetical protein